MRRTTAAALIAASAVGTAALLAAAQEAELRAPFWPATQGPPSPGWFTDVPWHQKLGTFAGNEIDEALVLPYEALGDPEKSFCTTNGLSQEDCMIELGINNILGMLRTDTPYSPQDPRIKAANECQDSTLPCIEVKLEVSSFWSRSTGSSVVLLPRPFGTEPAVPDGLVPSLPLLYNGYVITDGSTYAPSDALVYGALLRFALQPSVPDVQDPVCLVTTFPMNNGFQFPATPTLPQWPRAQP
jgi:hypothetical protein